MGRGSKLSLTIVVIVASLLLGVAGAVAQQVTLTLMGGTQENIQAMLPIFEEMHPHIKVEYIPIIEGDHNERVLLQIAAGAAPDVFLLDIPYVQVFHDQDLLLDLRTLAQRYDVPLDMYPDYVLDIFTRDGKVYALPKGFTPIVMLYNKQMFRERGVAEPQRGWTWAEFVQSARALTQDRDGDGEIDVYGVASPTWVGYTIPLMWAYGADFLSPDGTTAMGYTNGPATMDFFQDLQALQLGGLSPGPGVSGATLSAHRAAMGLSGHWGMFSLRNQLDSGEFEVGVMHLPQGPYAEVPETIIYSTGWAISKETKHVEAAIQLMNFLAGPIYMRMEALETLLEIPGHMDLIEELLATDQYNVEQEFVYAGQFGRKPWPTVLSGFGSVENSTLANAVNEIWEGAPVGPTLETAAHGIQTWLNEYFAGRR